MDATKFLNDISTQRQSLALQHLLEKQASDPSTQYHLKGLKSAAENRIDLFKQRLKEKYDRYTEPNDNVLACVSRYEKAKLAAIDEEKIIEHLTTHTEAGSLPITNLGQSRIIKDLDKPYVEVGEAFYPMNFFTGEVENRPLLNPSPPTWMEIETKVLVLSGTSKSVNVMDTITNLLDYCNEKGISKKDLGSLMKNFVQSYIPYISGAIYMKGSTDTIFETILNSINFHTITQNIRQAIIKLTRQPGEAIEIPLQAYSSLLCELAFIENPDIDDYEAAKKAKKQTMRIAKHFVHPHIAGQLDELRKQKSIKFDEDLQLKELITFITIMETEQGYALTAPVSLSGKHVSLSIFHTQFQQSTMRSINAINTGSNAEGSGIDNTGGNSRGRPRSPYYENPSRLRDNSFQRNRSSDKNGLSGKPTYNSDTSAVSSVNDYSSLGGDRSPANYSSSSADSYVNRNNYEFRPRPPTPYGRNRTPTNYGRNRTPSPSRSSFNNNSSRPRTPTPTRRFSSKSPQRNVYANNSRARSPSPGVWIRSRSGNRADRISRSRIMSNRPRSFSKDRSSPNRRNNRSPSLRKNSENSYAARKSPIRGKSPSNRCKLCGSTNHSTPTQYNKHSCPVYGRMAVQSKPCSNCKYNLLHAHYACQHGNPIRASRANSPANKPTGN